MRYIYLLLVILLTTGCVHTLKDEEILSSYNMPVTFRNMESINSLNTGKNQLEYKDPLEEIKHMLPDKEFSYVLDTASKESPDLLILLSKVRQAQYQIKSSTAAMAPKISGGLDYSYNDTKDGLNGSLSFSWELDIYGKLNALRKSQKEMIKYSQENYINGQVTLYADTATYYYSLRKSYAQLTFSKKMLENYKNILDIYKSMRKAGLIDEEEYMETAMDYLNAQNSIQRYQLEVEQNKNALFALINNKEINITKDLVYNTEFIPNIPKINDMPSEVVLNRPDVRSAVYSLNSELYRRYNKKASLLPGISIGGSIGKLLASSNGAADFVWQIVASITAPLINRQELYTQLKIQEESVFQAEQNLQKSINNAIADIENAAYATSSAWQSFLNTKTILENAKISMEILESRWKSGLIDDITYLQAQNNFLNTFSSFYNAWYENISSALRLYKAFGGSFSTRNYMAGNNNGNN